MKKFIIWKNNEIIEINKNGKEKKESKKDDKINDKKKKKHIESESFTRNRLRREKN